MSDLNSIITVEISQALFSKNLPAIPWEQQHLFSIFISLVLLNSRFDDNWKPAELAINSYGLIYAKRAITIHRERRYSITVRLKTTIQYSIRFSPPFLFFFLLLVPLLAFSFFFVHLFPVWSAGPPHLHIRVATIIESTENKQDIFGPEPFFPHTTKLKV